HAAEGETPAEVTETDHHDTHPAEPPASEAPAETVPPMLEAESAPLAHTHEAEHEALAHEDAPETTVEAGEAPLAAEAGENGSDHAEHSESEGGENGGENIIEVEEPAAAENGEDVVESVGGADALEEVQERTPRYRRSYKIQEVIKRRQIMLVQVVKEE